MRSLGFGMALLILSGTATASSQTHATGQVKSGEWVVHWSPSGAFAIHESSPRCVPIFRNSFENKRTGTGFQLGPAEGWFYRSTHHLLSAVGNIVSFTDRYEGSGGMHPISGQRYNAIDLETGETADVTQLFEEADVLKALGSDALILEHLQLEHIQGVEPKDLDELVGALGAPCEVDFSNLPSAFRVKAIHGERAVVEFGLGHGCETMRGTFTTLEIEVPIPADLRELFLEAHRNLPEFPAEDPILEEEMRR